MREPGDLLTALKREEGERLPKRMPQTVWSGFGGEAVEWRRGEVSTAVVVVRVSSQRSFS